MDLDIILEDLGQFGLFQVFHFTLLLFPVLMSSFRYTEYIFTTLDIPHRCRIPECEGTEGPVQFSPPWLDVAVPMSKDRVPEECQRYQVQYNMSYSNTTKCYSGMFDTNIEERCSNWVFSEPARTIIHDFGIMCPEDYWKRTLISSLSIFTSFIGLPLTGFLSDRFGRKTILVYGSIIIAVSGITRSFSINYAMLATLEMFDGLIIGSLYDPSFLLAIENLSPKKRLLGTMIITVYYAMGQVVLACLVWWTKDWRLLQRYFYIPMLVAVSLHWWLLTESIRWLYTNKRFDEMVNVVQKIARMNKTKQKLPNIIEHIKIEEAKEKDFTSVKPNESKPTSSSPFFKAIKSRIIMTRFGICTMSCILCLFTYYGLSQYAIQSNGNRYLSFLLVSVAELPGYVASLWAPGVTILGRKGAAAVSFFIMGVICLTLYFINHDNQILTLSLSLVAKFSSTLAITVIYLYTAELFPTEARHTLISVSVTLGSLGSIAAQQLPLFERYINSVLVYGMSSMIGAFVILIGPETMNTKLPDTILEAENIGNQAN